MFTIYKEHKVLIDLLKDRWYRVELLQEPSKKNGKADLSLRLNGVIILRAKVDEVDDIVNMWTVPRRGFPPALGQVRAITIFTSDDHQEFEIDVVPEKKKVLQGQYGDT